MSEIFFFFNDTATTEIYTLSLHDALPISRRERRGHRDQSPLRAKIEAIDCPGGHSWPPTAEKHRGALVAGGNAIRGDRKSTRLNSSHANISYAVFCLKKKIQTH